jgi:hypothetical protein
VRILVVCIALIVLSTLLFAACSRSTPPTQVSGANTLEDKLATLKTCGLQLSDPFTTKDLLKSIDRKTYEEPGYDLVLVGLGGSEEQEPFRDYSKNLWYFDTEAIEDTGDYKEIAERMVEMSEGSLPLTNIQDHVDIEAGEAWLSFDFKGKPIKVNCAVKDDFVDPAIFVKFVELLNESDPSKIYVYYDLGGQDAIIGCVTKSNYECLKNQGLKFVPLT